jgi:Mrp family chromosome partitioning ATPase/capsular polysaccharide biosynthesis protein
MTPESSSLSTLHDYLGVLRRRKWILIPPLVLAPVVAVVSSLGQPVRYEASAQVLVNRQNLPANLSGINDPSQLDSVRLLTTQAQFARLPTIARRTLRAVGLTNWSASDLLGESRVTSADNSDFLTFTVSDADQSRAMLLATAYANGYVAYRRDFERAQLESARRSLRERIRRLRLAGATDSRLYASLVDQADQLAAMEAVAASKGVLVRPATGAGRSQDNVVRNGILGFVLGLFTAVGLAFFRDALDRRVRSSEEVAGRLQLPLLGRVPRPPRAVRRANKLVILADPEGPHAEAFRMLRTSLEFVTPRGPSDSSLVSQRVHLRSVGQQCRRIMVTSAVEGEGKSTTVANLAVAFALAGRRVILVDLDFRRASLHRFFGLSGKAGLSDVVYGSAQLTDVVSDVDLDVPARSAGGSLGSLRVVPFGTSLPHAADAAFTLGLEHVLEQLTDAADLVLIDTSPLLRVGDTLALTAYVDGLLVVTSLTAMKPAMLDELRRVLMACPVAKLGFILTGADLEGGYEYLTYRYGRALSAG